MHIPSFFPQVLLLLSQFPKELVGEKAEPQRLFDAVNFLFSLQVRIHILLHL